LLIAILQLAPQLLAAPIQITGRVLSDSGMPLPAARVALDGVDTRTDDSGGFALTLPAGDLFALRFEADGHFPMVHTFSALELAWFTSGAGGAARLPDVSLVQRAPGRIMLAFGGDTMMGRRYAEPSPGEPVLVRPPHRREDALALLRPLEPYLQLADHTSVNLETQVMMKAPEGQAPKSFVFFSPPELLEALEVSGVDYVTLGNNHTNDYLSAGLSSTIDALEATGLGWSGAGLSESQALLAYRTRVGELPLGYLGFVGWAGNFTPNQVAQGADKSGAAYGTAQNIAATVRREVAAGFLPVVQYHGSREYSDEPTLVTETRLKQSIDAGAVVAIGHHPHIVQGFEIYRDRLIAYSLGNFMFDQFHYATTRSYLLYVWLDRDRLHAAEVMPLHIKGYVPMAATDSVRRSILKRVHELSRRRGAQPSPSGGHAMIRPGQDHSANDMIPLTLEPSAQPADRSVQPLHRRPWAQEIRRIEWSDNGDGRVRLGRNLLPTGHLESHYFHDAPDRSWIENGAQSVVAADGAPSGSMVMQLTVPEGDESARLGMRTFEYTFEPGTPTSFVVMARSERAATVTAFQQWRKRGEDRLEALAQAPLRPIGTVELEAGGWTELRFDFDSPRVSAISYRVVLQVSPQSGPGDFTAWFDDLALVEWLSPPLDPGDLPPHVASTQASHVDLMPYRP
jgi:poly-gamma-glutamate capsule biosynthesis protein CapA/YwtB (metallophosphatase superfamily)